MEPQPKTQPSALAAGGSVPVAVAFISALTLFCFVGYMASRAPAPVSPNSSALVVSIAVNDAEQAALQAAAQKISMPTVTPATASSEMAPFVVPANTPVLLETGIQTSCPGGGQSSTVWVPPLEPGHHLVRIGVHEFVVTAVQP